jgi:hypothetical protein
MIHFKIGLFEIKIFVKIPKYESKARAKMRIFGLGLLAQDKIHASGRGAL